VGQLNHAGTVTPLEPPYIQTGQKPPTSAATQFRVYQAPTTSIFHSAYLVSFVMRVEKVIWTSGNRIVAHWNLLQEVGSEAFSALSATCQKGNKAANRPGRVFSTPGATKSPREIVHALAHSEFQMLSQRSSINILIPFATKDTERSTRNPLSLFNVSQIERPASPAPLRRDVVLALYVKPRSWHQQHLRCKSTGYLDSDSPET
jgi:hypothetical protein